MYIKGFLKTRHKRHKFRKASNHAVLRCGVFVFKFATTFISHSVYPVNKKKKPQASGMISGYLWF